MFTHIYDHMYILFSGHYRSYTQEIIVIGQYSGRTTFQMGHAATQVSALERDGTKVQHNSLRGPAVSDCTVTFKGCIGWFHSVYWRNSLEPCLGEPVVLLFRPQILQVLEIIPPRKVKETKWPWICKILQGKDFFFGLRSWEALRLQSLIVEDVSIWVFLMIGKLLKARHLMMFQMTSSFQPVVSRRERSQPPRKSKSNNCELHLIALINWFTLLQPEKCMPVLPGTSRSTARSATLFTRTTESPGCFARRIFHLFHEWFLWALLGDLRLRVDKRSWDQRCLMYMVPFLVISSWTDPGWHKSHANWIQLANCVCTEEERVDWRRSKTNRLERTINYPCVDVLNMTDLNCRVLFTRRSG